MDFSFPPEDEAFRQEVRAFYQQELPPDWFGRERDPETEEFTKSVRRKLAAKRWLAMAWPKEYGGMDAPITRQLVFAEESAYHRFLAREAGVGFLGPAIIHHGTEEQKKRFLVPIAGGEVDLHQGFSEPDAGSDLAGLKTRADRDGDDYVINGQKIWGGHLDRAQYSFLLARTDQNVPKHKGISLLVIPANTPGLRYEEFENLAGYTQNVAYYDNCRVPIKECLIGEENQGWYIGTTVLNHERTVVEHAATGRRFLEDLVAFWKEGGRKRFSEAENRVMRHKLAQVAVEIEVCRMLSYRIGWLQGTGHAPTYEASQVKIFGSEMTQRFAHVASQLLGLYSQINREDSHPHYRPVNGRAEHAIRDQIRFSIIGGANEIQRNIIAARGLGLPRSY